MTEQKWYKVIRENMNHNGFRYKIGLNVDFIKFNPFGSCQPGGLYFTNAKNLHKFLDYGELIADIELPPDARVYKDPDEDKWKADRLVVKSVCEFKDHPLFKDHDWCLEVVKYNGLLLQYVKKQSSKICLAAVRENGMALRFVKKQSSKICLTAVRQCGFALEYVKRQTNTICLAAVRQNGYTLELVKNQTYKICLEAVKQDGLAIEYVKNQTHELCLMAVKRNGQAWDYITYKTPELYQIAIRNGHC